MLQIMAVWVLLLLLLLSLPSLLLLLLLQSWRMGRRGGSIRGFGQVAVEAPWEWWQGDVVRLDARVGGLGPVVGLDVHTDRRPGRVSQARRVDRQRDVRQRLDSTVIPVKLLLRDLRQAV